MLIQSVFLKHISKILYLHVTISMYYSNVTYATTISQLLQLNHCSFRELCSWKKVNITNKSLQD